MNKDILIVDDEEDIRHLIAGILQDDGFSTRLAWDYTSIKKEISKRIPSLILLDVWLENSDLDGIQILKLLKKSYPNIPIIMISGHGTIKMAINSLQVGAFNFIEKPFDTSLLVLNIKRAIEDAELKIKLSQFIDDDTIFIGKSNPALLVKSLIEKVAATKSRVFITGPTGSGKKHIAKLIHNKSSRALGAIVFLNTKRLIPDAIEEELFGKENVEGKYPDKFKVKLPYFQKKEDHTYELKNRKQSIKCEAKNTVENQFKVIFAPSAPQDTPALFSVKSMGGSLTVSLNMRHPAYDNLFEIISQEV